MYNDYVQLLDGTWGRKESSAPEEKGALATPTQAVSKPKKKTGQADRLVELAINEGIYLFRDQYREPCARIKIHGHFENWRLNSRDFKLYLGGLLYQSEGKSANLDAVRNALSTLSAEALHGSQSKTYPLHNRVAWLNDAIYYDLSDPTWRAVKITPEGWEIIDNPPILFRRYKHQIPQVEPVKGGDPWSLFEIIKVPPELQLLLLTWAISSLIPDIPHTIPIPIGPEGSAKSWLFYILRNVIDPSLYRELTLRGQQRELVQILDHNWCALFDNVSYLADWQADCLCRAVTGDGFSKRELYSDDEDCIYTFKRCIGLNGINLAVDRPDFLDRIILIPLDNIPEAERRSEKDDLEPRFAELKPYILGGFFDTLAKAIAIKPQVKLKRKPRMADFAEWGYAISEALGYSGLDFMATYSQNIQSRHKEIVAGTTIGFVVMSFMADKPSWEGTATELLALLTTEAESMRGVNTNAKDFPKAANALSAKLNELMVSLAQNGIIVEKMTNVGKAKQKGIKLTKTPSNVETSSTPSQASTEAEAIAGGRDDEPGVDDKASSHPPDTELADPRYEVDKIDDVDDTSLPPENF